MLCFLNSEHLPLSHGLVAEEAAANQEEGRPEMGLLFPWPWNRQMVMEEKDCRHEVQRSHGSQIMDKLLGMGKRDTRLKNIHLRKGWK